MNLELAQQPAQDVALGVQRVALLKLLKAAIPAHVRLRHSHAMTAVDCEHGFLFSDHGIRHGPFDLIVVADGANSALRRSLPSLVRRDRIYGSAAVVCCIDDRERIHTDCLNQYFDRTRHLSTWPVGPLVIGAPAGINLSMNIPLEQAGDLLACGGWKARVIAHSPQLACLMHGAAETARPAIYRYRDVELARSNLGRVVFIGDAAHSMSPQLGAGVWLALLDASVLAQTLREVDRPLAALSAFDRRQRSRVTRYQRLSRWLTPMFQSESPTRAVVRDTVIFGLMRMPVIARWVRSLLASE